ncbi:MAG: MupG family TIM beta-alpha barrel fold protein [Thomasclavelia sp.]|nr:MupG family TIM beta-alpha barrel fold protein [Thomasclavelia sp.]
MHNLGISVYPDKCDKKEMYDYMERASKYGFSRIFTCFLSIPEDKRESYIGEFKEFMNKAHELGFIVAADTNPEVFKVMGATPSNLKPFADLGLDIIRLDGNFGTQGDIEITRNPYNIKIEFNASMDMGVELLIKQGGNKDQITMCHNFFPERYTGLDFDLFLDLNAYWKELNLHTAAFVSSHNEDTIGPWEVFCGLPTVEDYRNLPIDLQARNMLATGDIDDVIIGNYPATDKELSDLANIDYQNVCFRVKPEEGICKLEEEIMYDYKPHWGRYDYSSYMIRSSMPRVKYKGQSIPYRKCDKPFFEIGDVLIVNDNLAHYRGELEIVTQEIPNDGERNLVGTILPEEMIMLEFVDPGKHFKLLK